MLNQITPTGTILGIILLTNVDTMYTLIIKGAVITMYTSIQRWGNSNAVRLPKAILDTLNMRESDRVEIIAEKQQIVIRPAKRKYASLDELFEGYTGGYVCTEAETGTVGREVL